MAGTPFYMAPEVLKANYSTKADIWSLGVLLYTLVSGYLPFQGSNNTDVFDRIRNADFHFDHEEFDIVSKECKDFISKLIVVDVKKRLDGNQALQHNWFKTYAEGKLH
jgi:serine/threonine protein kinase